MIEIFFPVVWSEAQCERWLHSSQYWPGLVCGNYAVVTLEDMSQYVLGYDGP